MCESSRAPDPNATQQCLLGATPELINAAPLGNLFSMTINGDKWSLSLHKNNGLILYPRRFLLGISEAFQQLIVVKQRHTLYSEGVPSLPLENSKSQADVHLLVIAWLHWPFLVQRSRWLSWRSLFSFTDSAECRCVMVKLLLWEPELIALCLTVPLRCKNSLRRPLCYKIWHCTGWVFSEVFLWKKCSSC